jgi:hypothetical protein
MERAPGRAEAAGTIHANATMGVRARHLGIRGVASCTVPLRWVILGTLWVDPVIECEYLAKDDAVIQPG